MTAVQMAREDRVHLAGVLARLLRWDESSVVRLISSERALGLFLEAPMGVLVFTALPLAQTPPVGVDRAVSAHRLRDILGDVTTAAPGVAEVKIPDERDMPAALAVLPSREGWIAAEKATAGELVDAADAARAEYEQSWEALAGATDAAREAFLEEWWNRPSWGGLPNKALHAARSLGMLAHPAARVEAATRAGWKRLITPAGQVFVAPPESYAGIPLSVVK